MKLGGVIYLQNIVDRRMEGATRRNLDMFRQLCGEKALAKVILVTTSWEEVTQDVGDRREKQLADKFWKEMIILGSKMRRFHKTKTSALAILDDILGETGSREPGGSAPGAARTDSDDALQIQHELVDLQQYIPETSAGKELRYTLQQLLKMQKDMAGGGDPEEEAELAAKQEKVRKQINDLKIPLPRRILLFFGLT